MHQKDSEERVLICFDKSGANVAVPMVSMVKWLHSKTSSHFFVAVWQIMLWQVFMVDHSSALWDASDDPLDLPTYNGPGGKAQNTQKHKKYKIAKMAARGQLARSVRASIEILNELRPGFTSGSAGAGNE